VGLHGEEETGYWGKLRNGNYKIPYSLPVIITIIKSSDYDKIEYKAS
jgi:hypothetical protein